MRLVETTHAVNFIPPIDANDGAITSDVISLKNADHVTFYVQMGAVGATTNILLFECDDFTPTNSTGIGFTYYAEETTTGDTLGTATTVTAANGIDTHATTDSIMYVIEVDAADLTDGYPNLQMTITDPGTATLVSVLAVLSGLKYGGTPTPTAIA